MNILVLGASGGCGSYVVAQGVQRGHKVTALVREETSFAASPEVEVIRGSVLDYSTLEKATRNQDAVISCLGLKRKNKLNPWSSITSPLDLTTKTAENLMKALPADFPVAVISAAGVGESFDRTNSVLQFLIRKSNLGPAYQDLENMEELLSSGELNWHAVRPVTLTNGKQSKKTSVNSSYGLFDMISRASVASWLLDVIEQGGYPQSRTPIIKG
ncbi:MAG: NAD-dependent epimerase/dehydratase family protein [Balneola sp.]|nr:MAG: NAD-dependent epimerase/dehydratase family protein [Balneola sp.]